MSPVLFDRELFLVRLWELDDALVACGFPAISPWWRAQIERFVRSVCRRWVIRAGRRAGKSTTLARLAVCWAWLGAHHVPPGDVGVIMFVSVSRDESAMRLRTIAAVLTALGLAFEQRNDEIEMLGERQVLFRTAACSTTSVVGFTSIAVFCDEAARWESRDERANPAREVVGSLAPTLATQDHGFMVLCSSPWSTDDYHAELFEQGDTEHQITSFSESWVANPTLTEARTHELEPDLRTWLREYAAQPGVTVSSAFDTADIAECFDRPFPARVTPSPRGFDQGRGFLCIDASSLRGDTFAWIAGYISGQTICVRDVGGWGGEQLRRVSMADIVREISDHAKDNHIGTVYGDQREEAALRSLFAGRNIGLTTYAWSEPSKDAAVQLLRRLMRERRLVLPAHAQLRRELTAAKARLQPSGRIRYDHMGDSASCLVTLAHAIIATDLSFGSDGQCPIIQLGSPTLLRAEREYYARSMQLPYRDEYQRGILGYPKRGHYSD